MNAIITHYLLICFFQRSTLEDTIKGPSVDFLRLITAQGIPKPLF